MIRIAALGACLLMSVSACRRSPPDANAPDGAAPPGATPLTATLAYVKTVTTLRRDPTDAPRVPGPSGKTVANALAVLQRGEKVTLVETREDLARVRVSDDREGWLRRSALLEGETLSEATVLVPADVFDRPDLLAANAKRKIDPGTLLLVVKTRPPFSEVNAGSGPNAWVLSERLATGETEVSVAKLAEKARWLKRSGKDDDAREILALARQNFPGAPLLDALAVEIEGAPQPEGEVVPTSGAAPPGQ
jgi:uncharacterized protein YgiM (DUF1202 family)